MIFFYCFFKKAIRTLAIRTTINTAIRNNKKALTFKMKNQFGIYFTDFWKKINSWNDRWFFSFMKISDTSITSLRPFEICRYHFLLLRTRRPNIKIFIVDVKVSQNIDCLLAPNTKLFPLWLKSNFRSVPRLNERIKCSSKSYTNCHETIDWPWL